MGRVCDLTGKKLQFGHNVSHSNRKTNRTFAPNIQTVKLQSEALGRAIPMSVSTRALRTVNKKGGIDAFLMTTADEKLPVAARRLKRQIKKKIGAQ